MTDLDDLHFCMVLGFTKSFGEDSPEKQLEETSTEECLNWCFNARWLQINFIIVLVSGFASDVNNIV